MIPPIRKTDPDHVFNGKIPSRNKVINTPMKALMNRAMTLRFATCCGVATSIACFEGKVINARTINMVRPASNASKKRVRTSDSEELDLSVSRE